MHKHSKLIAGLLSIALHILLCVGLWFFYVSSEQPQKEMQEIEFVPIEWEDEPIPEKEETLTTQPSAGAQQSPAPSAKPSPPSPTKPQGQAVPTRKVSTLATTTKPSPMTTDKATPQDLKETEEAHQKQIEDRLSQAFSGKGKPQTTSSSGQGTSSGSSASGKAGWSLEGSGRSIVGNGGVPVVPNGVPDIRGTLKIRIVVNSDGDVIEARPLLKGSDITDSTIIRQAIEAARKTKFNKVPTTNNQRGVITYRFDVH